MNNENISRFFQSISPNPLYAQKQAHDALGTHQFATHNSPPFILDPHLTRGAASARFAPNISTVADYSKAKLEEHQVTDVLQHVIAGYKVQKNGIGKPVVEGNPNSFISAGKLRKQRLFVDRSFRESVDYRPQPYNLGDVQHFFAVHKFDETVLTYDVVVNAIQSVLGGTNTAPTQASSSRQGMQRKASNRF